MSSDAETSDASADSYESSFDDADLVAAMHELLSDADGNTIVSSLQSIKKGLDKQNQIMTELLNVMRPKRPGVK